MVPYLSGIFRSALLLRIRDTAISVGVLYRRGFLRPSGLAGGVHAFRIARSQGPLVGAFAPSLRQKPNASAIVDVRANLARYKVPRTVRFVAEFPRNSTGKLLRSELVRMAGEPENSSQVR